jgi:hypothetical protein
LDLSFFETSLTRGESRRSRSKTMGTLVSRLERGVFEEGTWLLLRVMKLFWGGWTPSPRFLTPADSGRGFFWLIVLYWELSNGDYGVKHRMQLGYRHSCLSPRDVLASRAIPSHFNKYCFISCFLSPNSLSPRTSTIT